MKRQFSFIAILICGYIYSQSPFHTLKMPQPSNKVTEIQTLGVTDIILKYSSPSLDSRDVWNDANVIPRNGTPYPWRAGANMNTTIEFDTELTIEDLKIKKGKYGLHIIPNDKTKDYTVLLAKANDLWGSYYLDIEKDISYKFNVRDTICPFTEKLDFEFYHKSDSTMILALEWGIKRISMRVAVDLKETVINRLRSELRGINTYRWEAWHDAAQWCMENDINLEEALSWINRSINGVGNNQFGGQKNITNLTMKARIAKKLKKQDLYDETINEALSLNSYSAQQAHDFTMYLFRNKQYSAALKFNKKAIQFHNEWFIKFNFIISNYLEGNHKVVRRELKNLSVPEWFTDRFNTIKEQLIKRTYHLPD
ncbi:DUF2911 domain-containing protein [uncultured Winogradskyella sp.]|uniref:DUF2911 domain-containing protein n=1 Tax=uncultured Winogradskyella sp. TaxID=395353 RepID=UPI002621936D|nr:DUF2911 domain-containing protein [uncultured Winogradskyella sp.]